MISHIPLDIGILNVNFVLKVDLSVHGGKLSPFVSMFQLTKFPDTHLFEFLQGIVTPVAISDFVICQY